MQNGSKLSTQVLFFSHLDLASVLLAHKWPRFLRASQVRGLINLSWEAHVAFGLDPPGGINREALTSFTLCVDSAIQEGQ